MLGRNVVAFAIGALALLSTPCASLGQLPVFVGSWDEEGCDSGQLRWPTGVTLSSQGMVFVSDAACSVIRVREGSGAEVNAIRHETMIPFSLDVSPLGDRLYAHDLNRERVLVFSTQGDYVAQWLGDGSSLFQAITDIEVDDAGRVFVADFLDSTIRVFDGEGQLMVRSLPLFSYTRSLDLDSSGRVWVYREGRMEAHDPATWALVTSWPTESSIWDFEFGSDGRIYGVAGSEHRIEVYSVDGSFVGSVGSEGSGAEQFNTPEQIAMSPELDIWVADHYNHRIQLLKVASTPVRRTTWGGVKSLYR